MNKTKGIIFTVILLVSVSPPVLSSGLYLNGLGAKAIAMGGAFTGIADDISAIFWNPAGIAQYQTTTFGVYGGLLYPSYSYKYLSEFEAKTISTIYPEGIISLFFPIGKRIVAGIGIQTISNFQAEWEGSDLKLITHNMSYEWKTNLGILTLSPTLAFKISDSILIGASFNLSYSIFDISRHAGVKPVPTSPGYFMPFDLGQSRINMKGWGLGASFGILLKPTNWLSMGASFRTSSTMSYSGGSSISKFSLLGYPEYSDIHCNMDFPMRVMGGLALHPFKNLTVSFDASYTNWKKLVSIEFNFKDVVWNAVGSEDNIDKIMLKWKDTIQYRMGIEYTIKWIAFRAGYYLDPAVASDETMSILFPNYTFDNISFGIGFISKGFRIDLVGQYSLARDRDINILNQEAMPGQYTGNRWTAGLSIGFGSITQKYSH